MGRRACEVFVHRPGGRHTKTERCPEASGAAVVAGVITGTGAGGVGAADLTEAGPPVVGAGAAFSTAERASLSRCKVPSPGV